MLTFFRKIRRSLIDSGSARRYILYAIGEILLVMIGILLALQVNNWNEWRKDRKQEKILLQDLVKNLEINIQTLRDDIDFLNRMDHSSKVIIDALNNRIGFTDSLKIHFHQAWVPKQDLFLSNVGYQALKDEGISILTNKALSDEILDLFEVTIPKILSTNSMTNKGSDSFNNHVVQNFTFREGLGQTPNDYESLFDDEFYISWIKAYQDGRIYLIKTDNRLIDECNRVLQLIYKELEE